MRLPFIRGLNIFRAFDSRQTTGIHGPTDQADRCFGKATVH